MPKQPQELAVRPLPSQSRGHPRFCLRGFLIDTIRLVSYSSVVCAIVRDSLTEPCLSTICFFPHIHGAHLGLETWEIKSGVGSVCFCGMIQLLIVIHIRHGALALNLLDAIPWNWRAEANVRKVVGMDPTDDCVVQVMCRDKTPYPCRPQSAPGLGKEQRPLLLPSLSCQLSFELPHGKWVLLVVEMWTLKD